MKWGVWRSAAFLMVLLAVTSCRLLMTNEVLVRQDEFSDDLTFISPSKLHNSLDDAFRARWFIRSYVAKNASEMHHQLYIHTIYDAHFIHFVAANDEDAAEMQFLPLHHVQTRSCLSTQGCQNSEDVAVLVSTSYLQDHRKTGVRIKILGKTGFTFIAAYTPETISKQLDAIATYAKEQGRGMP